LTISVNVLVLIKKLIQLLSPQQFPLLAADITVEVSAFPEKSIIIGTAQDCA